MKKINLAITGCMGRMGQEIIKSVKRDKSFKRQAEALLYNNYKDLCTFKEGIDLVKNIYNLRW